MMQSFTCRRVICGFACLLAILCWGQSQLAVGQTPTATDAQSLDLYETAFGSMGTQLAFQAYAKDEATVEKLFKLARREVDRLADMLTDYSTESETVLLSRPEMLDQWQTVSPDLWQVLQVCDRWHHLSDGAFDASVGQLTSLWRKARKAGTVPSREEIEQALASSGWQYVELDPQKRAVRIKRAGLRFDFGAMGKGYVIDRAYDVLARGSLDCALVRAGGDLRCGTPPPGKPGWPVEIGALPAVGNADAQEQPMRLYLANAAISSSGDLYQFSQIDGIRRSHVLDPRTGWGVPGPRMVTVIAQSSTEADAADTAMCIMKDEQALQLANRVGKLQVRLATAQTSAPPIIRLTPNFGQQGGATLIK